MKFSGAKLRKYREEQGLSHEGMAQRMYRDGEYKISRQSLINWEHGKYNPTTNDLCRISDLLEKPIECFFVR